jgi:hypothetical protein
MSDVIKFNKRLEALKSERSSFIPYWMELSDYHLAHRGRFLTSDVNKGHKRNTRQVNNTSKLAARTLASGMMAGITSPARPWFQLGAPDPKLNDVAAVKDWLFQVQTIMYRVFSQSNTYISLHSLYGEMGVFGTGAMGVFEDFDNVIRCKPYTIGSYCLGKNGRDEIDTFYREYQKTVGECVKLFGFENCSAYIQQQWRDGNTEAWIELVHAVEPNDNRDQMSPMARDMKVRSVYYEKSRGSQGKSNDGKILKRSGFEDFPILAPRWDVTGEDTYATDCSGMTCLGDTKALQLGEKRAYQAVDKLANPPLQGDATLKTKVANGNNLKPDEIIWTENGSAGLTSIYGNYRPDLAAMELKNGQAEGRIKKAFYEDLFLMLANSDRRQITAREVAEKQEEKLLMLGPVLERLHNELLDPLINRTFNILQNAGILPPPPPELRNVELGVEYISILAQAQRMVAVGGIERLTDYTMNLATMYPEARHKVNPNQLVDDYAEAMGVNPNTVRSNADVDAIVEQERQAAQAAQTQETAAQMAQTAKTASETNTTGDNALNVMLQNAGLQ